MTDAPVLFGDHDRYDRVARLTEGAHGIIRDALADHLDGHQLTGTLILYSGGNDSTTLAHMFKDTATAAVHINTGIGIEETRQFVRDTCARWALPLIEKHPPPGSTYRELVLDQGFPGPGHHFKMYQRLKERGLRQVRKEFVTNPREQRVLFLAGRRREESDRRQSIPETERTGSIIWASPLAHFTKHDLNTYREMHPDVPRNEVSDALHMSGECLCGAFAAAGELDEIAMWYPAMAAHIRELEAEVEAAGHKRCRWGWGADSKEPRSKSGALCSSCEGRQLTLEGMEEAA